MLHTRPARCRAGSGALFSSVDSSCTPRMHSMRPRPPFDWAWAAPEMRGMGRLRAARPSTISGLFASLAATIAAPLRLAPRLALRLALRLCAHSMLLIAASSY
ncbi:hypothetical protein P154DRAFT_576459 [Amniculicola lignicola CBS 123094]|uniref:Uncharacterized protein n=1 Tax=Amniculicola lignicola CBS 123094 TaxID=1392246 RepID=A0A6A5WGE0_9PLEO|nr:hypothetical protein P154DRAFT_576459 [Amniculicola lignicola CBS 123094]